MVGFRFDSSEEGKEGLMDYIMCERGNRGRGSRTEWDTRSRRRWDPYRYYRHGEVGLTTRYIITPKRDGLLGFLEHGMTVGDVLIAAAVAFLMYHLVWLAWLAFAPIV